MHELRWNLFERAEVQRGLLTRADLASLSITRGARRRLIDEGTLVALGPQVFRVGGLQLDVRGQVLAACLDLGAVASHRTAAWLHGIPGFSAPTRPEVVRRGRKADHRSALAIVHSTTWLPSDDLIPVAGIPATSVARTLFSLASLVPEVPLERVRAAVDDAVRLRIASDRWMWHRLEKLRCRGRNGVSAFESILTARSDSPTESWLEREALCVLAAGGLPAPRCQARVRARGAFVARVDFMYEAERIVIEVTGAVGHSTPAQRAADARRRNKLMTEGYLVLEFTYEQVVGEPEWVVAQVAAALVARHVA